MQRKISLFQSDPEDYNSEVNRSVEHIDYADIFNFFQPLLRSNKNVETRNINSGTTTIEGAILKELTFINTKKQKAYALSYMAGIKDTLTVWTDIIKAESTNTPKIDKIKSKEEVFKNEKVQ